MDALSWRSGLLLAGIISLILGLQVTAIGVIGKRVQHTEPIAPVKVVATPGCSPAPPLIPAVAAALVPRAAGSAPATTIAAETRPAIADNATPLGPPATKKSNPRRQAAVPKAPLQDTPQQAVPTPTTTDPQPMQSASLEQVQAIPSKPAKPKPVATSPKLQEPRWLQTRDPAHFTLQLLSHRSTTKLREFARSPHLPQPLAYYCTLRRSKPACALVAGDYADQQQAQRANANLTAHLPALKPWIRRFGEIQAQLR